MDIILNNSKLKKFRYKNENEFETDVVNNYKKFFGEKTIYIDVKKKIESHSLGGTIPDGFFFDFSDDNDHRFYLVEVELCQHSFFNHIFPQITKFFAFYRNLEQRKSFVEKLFLIIDNDETLKRDFKELSKAKEIYKYLSDMIESSQNILLILDGQKRELPEILDTYTDTWGRMVKHLVIQKYIDAHEMVFTIDPEYDAIEYIEEKISNIDSVLNEQDHFIKSNVDIVDTYKQLKLLLHKDNPNYVFNSQRYYVSVRDSKNITYIKFQKKSLKIIPLIEESIIRDLVKHYKVQPLSESVKNFYGNECAKIDVSNSKFLEEIVSVIKAANSSNTFND